METTALAPGQRLLSLDFFRGITVAAMILVNNPGSWKHIYAPLEHAVWNGCTPTDLVFPFFLFIVGVSIVYAMENKKANPQEHPKLLWIILRRSLMIIGLGIALSLLSDFQFSHMRIPGVLPRIALVFGISAFIYVKTNTKTQLYILLVLLIGYYLLMTFVPVPGIGAANLMPETNLGAWLDRLVFTENHLWRGAKGWDPEGLLGTIPAVGTALTGILTGTFLKKGAANRKNGLGRLIVYGIGLIVMGMIWNLTFPINKSLWTSSFVLFTSGLAIIMLSISYWIIDVKGWKKGISPFVAFGRNPITAYTLAGLVPTIFSWINLNVQGRKINIWSYLNQYVLEPAFSPKNASLIAAILIVLLLFAPIWWMYQKKIIIKI